MKQVISVRALINEGGKYLLFKRSSGRESILGKYELPGGKLDYGEQPEDALRRYLHDDTGLHAKSSQLFDAVTYVDYDDRAIQYCVITYIVTLSSQRHPMKLGKSYSKYKWQSLSDIQHNEVTDLTQLLLGIVRQGDLTDEAMTKSLQKDVANTSKLSVIIYSDGGSRGNPGPSAAGYVMMNRNEEVIDQGGEYLGVTTNNQAEYHGVRIGLEKAREQGFRDIDFRLDSMLVVNQMNGLYKIKNRELWPIHERIRILSQQFDSVSFTHVNRKYNQLADGVVNKILNEHASDKA